VATRSTLLEPYRVEIHDRWPTEAAWTAAGSLWPWKLDGRLGTHVV
jgi:hypothetical protein